MNLKGILSIATYPGLYRHVAQAKSGLIIESIVDGKRQLAYATSRISALEDISIYTTDGDTKLSEVYKSLFEALGGKATPFNPRKASNSELVELFGKALANWDPDRVYISDIKRAFIWYNILVETGLAAQEAEQEASQPEEKEAAQSAEPAAEEGEIKTKKRSRKKAAPKEDGQAAAE